MRALYTDEKESWFWKVVCVVAFVCVYGEVVVLLRFPGGAIKKPHTPERNWSCIQKLGRWAQSQDCRCLCLKWGIEIAHGHVAWKLLHLQGHPEQNAKCFSSNSFEQNVLRTRSYSHPNILAQSNSRTVPNVGLSRDNLSKDWGQPSCQPRDCMGTVVEWWEILNI